MNDEQRTEPASDWHEQQARAAARPQMIAASELPIPQRLGAIEQALAGLVMGLQQAANRQAVADAIKLAEDRVEAVETRLSAFQSIVTESLTLTNRLDGIDRGMLGLTGQIERLPSVQQLAAVSDSAGQIQGAQTVIGTEIGKLRDSLARLLRVQRWQWLGVTFVGAGVMFAGAALLVLALGART
jgi:hypothetical protein